MANESERDKLQNEKQTLVKRMARLIQREQLTNSGEERDKIVKEILDYKHKIHEINEQLTKLTPSKPENPPKVIPFPSKKS
jgi:hypothetical protein